MRTGAMALEASPSMTKGMNFQCITTSTADFVSTGFRFTMLTFSIVRVYVTTASSETLPSSLRCLPSAGYSAAVRLEIEAFASGGDTRFKPSWAESAHAARGSSDTTLENAALDRHKRNRTSKTSIG
jgi:hypothetical protein